MGRALCWGRAAPPGHAELRSLTGASCASLFAPHPHTHRGTTARSRRHCRAHIHLFPHPASRAGATAANATWRGRLYSFKGPWTIKKIRVHSANFYIKITVYSTDNKNYSLRRKKNVVLDFRATSLTRFVENMWNIYISK